MFQKVIANVIDDVHVELTAVFRTIIGDESIVW